MCCSTFIEEMKARPIQENLAIGLIACAEKDGGREDPLEAFHEAVVSFSVFEEVEEVEHLGCGAETDAAVFGGRTCRSGACRATDLRAACGVEATKRRLKQLEAIQLIPIEGRTD
jgi:hypothetical protein